jgi:hypothetical protein
MGNVARTAPSLYRSSDLPRMSQLRSPLQFAQCAFLIANSDITLDLSQRIPRGHLASKQQSGSTPHDAVVSDRRPPRHSLFLPALRRQRPSSHHYLGFTSAPATNPVAPRPDRSFTPTYPTTLGRKPIAATVTIQPQQARTRGKIPIAPAAPPPHTSRDFVPWRFLDAGRKSAWKGSSCRRPKTCTIAAVSAPSACVGK